MAGRKVYRSMQGKVVDMDLLAQKHELTPAIGNAKMNARGDELGPGGKIIRRREDILAAYYDNNPNAVSDEHYVRPQVQRAAPAVTEETKPTTVKKEVRNDRKSKTDS